MKVTGYHHLSLSVTDLDRSVAWYSRVLGFSHDGGRETTEFVRAFLVQPETGVRLALTRHHHSAAEAFSEVRTGMDHVAFQVPSREDVEAYKDHFDALGVAHSEIKPTRAGSGAMIVLRDPDNIQLEVFTPRG